MHASLKLPRCHWKMRGTREKLRARPSAGLTLRSCRAPASPPFIAGCTGPLLLCFRCSVLLLALAKGIPQYKGLPIKQCRFFFFFLGINLNLSLYLESDCNGTCLYKIVRLWLCYLFIIFDFYNSIALLPGHLLRPILAPICNWNLRHGF